MLPDIHFKSHIGGAAMRHFSILAVLFLTVLFISLFISTGEGLCQQKAEADPKPAKPTILGPWYADSVMLLSSNGEKKTLPKSEQQPFNIIVTDKFLTMRVGDQKFAEMQYTSDAKESPATLVAKLQDQDISSQKPVVSTIQRANIDVKFQDQDMPGIFELKDESLKISLNDSKKGRPKNFDGNDNDMVIVLHRYQGEPLMMINSDGTNLRTLFSMPEFTSAGSPEWSHDGGKITFDSWRSIYGEDYGKSHVFTVNADGKSPKDLGDGTLPSWSPDGKQITFCRYSPNYGIWVMNTDGSNLHTIDVQGWGPDWSPKNDELAYTTSAGGGANICVHDLKTNDRRYLLKKQYSQIYWGLSWSSDGQWICYEGVLPDGSSEVAVVHRDGESKGFKILLPNKEITDVKEVKSYFSWSPDSKQILVPLKLKNDKNLQLYIFDPDGKSPPKILAGQDATRRFYGSSWSPDGKNIVLSFWPTANSGE